nr:unnamed protein product [Callosobruchus chinensis]
MLVSALTTFVHYTIDILVGALRILVRDETCRIKMAATHIHIRGDVYYLFLFHGFLREPPTTASHRRGPSRNGPLRAQPHGRWGRRRGEGATERGGGGAVSRKARSAAIRSTTVKSVRAELRRPRLHHTRE